VSPSTTAAAVDPSLEAARQRTIANVRRLNDVLARSPMAGRSWVWAGLLLGCAREGTLLAHDADDVDFAFLGEDLDRLVATIPLLAAEGFTPHYRFPGLHGEVTEYSFWCDGAKFEFFRLDVEGDRFVYHHYGHDEGRPVRNRLEIPAQPLEEFEFLDRRWLKVRDHDLELTVKYGDWRTPATDWNYLRSPDIVATTDWNPTTFDLWGAAFAAGEVVA
jgi:hypothetical protein